jgi:hypothetical protein
MAKGHDIENWLIRFAVSTEELTEQTELRAKNPWLLILSRGVDGGPTEP